ncbi:MAG: hypothetical protein WAL56_10550 [Candidatus Sulfotelmatobacter sp.]
MRVFTSISVGLLLLAGAPLWSQQDKASIPAPAVSGGLLGASNDVSVNPDAGEDRMLTPPPVSGGSFPASYMSEERSNYLRGGVTFNTSYSDNVLGATSTTPVSDVSYSVWPTIALDETTSRLHTVLTYAPGFTFYERTTSRNEQDQNLSLALQYRLSPHVTVSLADGFQKSSSIFNQPDQGLAGAVSGTAQGANDSIVAPLADRLSNNGNAGITYQFAANAMVGASGTFTNLHYPDPTEVPGLYDAASRGGSAFYSYRVSQQHYVGVTYQYQELLSYPMEGTNETRTDAFLFFYTFYPAPRFSFSLFGGPQYYSAGAQFLSASQPIIAASSSWTPSAGASVNWQSLHTGMAVSYARTVSGGGGLVGAVELDSANASLRQQLTRNLSASLAGGYANNGVLSVASLGGHSISASAALQRQVGEHFNVQAGYTRLHQNYSFLAANPDTNREWVAVSYQFSRPLGR